MMGKQSENFNKRTSKPWESEIMQKRIFEICQKMHLGKMNFSVSSSRVVCQNSMVRDYFASTYSQWVEILFQVEFFILNFDVISIKHLFIDTKVQMFDHKSLKKISHIFWRLVQASKNVWFFFPILWPFQKIFTLLYLQSSHFYTIRFTTY